MYLSIVRYHQTAIPSGVAKISSFYEENLSDPNPQTANIKSGIRAENLGLKMIYEWLHIAHSVLKYRHLLHTV